ncbi:hypothetical protein TWF730_000168 [Orbilia blumenaviensis]|uniref:Uncharacterized protein n=1 Tax=Orbilia blumenaviensis TaxID=1796055 RepID=A0AAV9VL26_9PEZI
MEALIDDKKRRSESTFTRLAILEGGEKMVIRNLKGCLSCRGDEKNRENEIPRPSYENPHAQETEREEARAGARRGVQNFLGYRPFLPICLFTFCRNIIAAPARASNFFHQIDDLERPMGIHEYARSMGLPCTPGVKERKKKALFVIGSSETKSRWREFEAEG